MRRPPAPGLNASYSLERRFVWLRIAKTGTRSLNALLRTEVVDYRRLNRTEPLTDEFVALLAGPHLAFTVVRDPWTRLISAWSSRLSDAARRGPRTQSLRRLQHLPMRVRREITSDFTAFVERLPDLPELLFDRHFAPQVELHGGVHLHRVCRFEALEHDLAEVLDRVGVHPDRARLPHIGSRPGGPTDPATWYSPATARTVGMIYAEDTRRWGYAGPFPDR
jgi:hypothetical protein